jgi:CRP-like cAMP-binding protein
MPQVGCRGERVDAQEFEGIPLFADLSKKERERVARWADVVDVPAGYHLLIEGRFPHEFFVVLDGTVDVEKGGEHLAELGRGAFLGEIALIEDDRRTATVVARTPVRALVMGPREFDEMRDEMPTVAERLEAAKRERLQR